MYGDLGVKLVSIPMSIVKISITPFIETDPSVCTI